MHTGCLAALIRQQAGSAALAWAEMRSAGGPFGHLMTPESASRVGTVVHGVRQDDTVCCAGERTGQCVRDCIELHQNQSGRLQCNFGLHRAGLQASVRTGTHPQWQVR